MFYKEAGINRVSSPVILYHFLSNEFMGLMRNVLDFSYNLIPKYIKKEIYRSISMPKSELETCILKRITCVYSRMLFRKIQFTLV